MNSRENKKQILLWIDKDLYKKVKYQALDEDTSATLIITKAVECYLAKQENKKN